jgi:hypothetical protein
MYSHSVLLGAISTEGKRQNPPGPPLPKSKGIRRLWNGDRRTWTPCTPIRALTFPIFTARKRKRETLVVPPMGTFLEDLNAQGVLTHAIACGVFLAPSFRDFPLLASVRRLTRREAPAGLSSRCPCYPRVWGNPMAAWDHRLLCHCGEESRIDKSSSHYCYRLMHALSGTVRTLTDRSRLEPWRPTRSPRSSGGWFPSEMRIRDSRRVR